MNLLEKVTRCIKNPTDAISYFTGINYCYSQAGEDLILKYLIHKKSSGIYIDIGANEPRRFNNTYMFYKYGWRGINIEPNKNLIKKFVKQRPDDINLQVACGSGSELKFFEFHPHTMSTCDSEAAERYQKQGLHLVDTYSVPTLTLAQIFEQYYNNNHVDILSVDVEGYDMDVLESNNRELYRPGFIILETVEYGGNNLGKKLNNIYDVYMKSIGYEVFADTYINTIYRDIH